MLREGLRERSVAGVDCALGRPVGGGFWSRKEPSTGSWQTNGEWWRTNPTEVDDEGFVGLSRCVALKLLGIWALQDKKDHLRYC